MKEVKQDDLHQSTKLLLNSKILLLIKPMLLDNISINTKELLVQKLEECCSLLKCAPKTYGGYIIYDSLE